MFGRGGSVRSPRALSSERVLSGTEGVVLDPVFAMRRRMCVPPGATASVAFWTIVAHSRAQVLDLVDKHREGAEGDPVSYAPQGLAEGISTLAAEPVFSGILAHAGPPRFRRRRNGFGTLLHIILEQQVSIDAAAAMHKRLIGLCRPLAPATFLALDDATLRSCGFSRQKMGYARNLAELVAGGDFDFARLARADDIHG